MTQVIVKPCEECSKNHSFEQKEITRGFGRFCSRRCAALYRVKNMLPPEANTPCAYCFGLFHINPTRKSKSKSGLFFCCREHKDAAQKIGGIKEIMPSHYGTGNPQNTYRRIVFSTKPKVCERCKYDSHEAAIVVHHKDRNRENNELTNLEVLCANCHAIEHWGE